MLIIGAAIVATGAPVTAVPPETAVAEAGTAAAPVWGDCTMAPQRGIERDPRQQCAILKVPLDYRAPRGRTIEITISRIATARPGTRRGILLSNPGGPGDQGLDLASALGTVLPRRFLIWPCAAWPTRPAEPPVTVTGNGARNVLILQNTRDPSTSLRSARGLRATLGRRAAMITVDQGGHGVFGLGSCADEATNTFLATGKLPARDRFCPAPSPVGDTVRSAAVPYVPPGWPL
ncbi:alpha/beta hydrolase [Nonomuraea endophytica]|uniref:Peptidase S33 tripeptidyl aminopeptidase-like C-terminal domain-containing protein n=1 Tax=Nonomuraea endophytica TaxID=714136 RepID=A0A7W8EHF2_9ACTN|nr:alpha/beta hydrolase [Nonomuraea endophytica]MBB5079524.1 hypothetical protein [Nonomuraea endophytica]